MWPNSKHGYFGRLKRTEAEKTNTRDCMGRPMLAGGGQTRYTHGVKKNSKLKKNTKCKIKILMSLGESNTHEEETSLEWLIP